MSPSAITSATTTILPSAASSILQSVSTAVVTSATATASSKSASVAGVGELDWVELLLSLAGLVYTGAMAVLSTLAGAVVKTLKMEVPTAVKVIFWVLCLINIKNVPLTWHVSVSVSPQG